MQNFNLFKIEDSLKDSITRMKFKEPTPIQNQAIPVALEGKDILGTAQTGTGKTLAFSIPLINKLILDKNAFALVTCPTRELATQVMDAIKNLISNKINIKTALLIGGESMQKQLRQLGKRSRLIVGTPGRINDHLKRKSLNLSATKYLVLDETDRMLDMGFIPQIEMILKFVPKDHQTLLFSATLPKDILRISERYLTNPIRISVGSTTVPIAKIKQETLQVYKENKYNELIDQLLSRKGSILVFVKTKRNADRMVKRLKEEDHSAEAIHGDLRQSKRDRVMNAFRKGVKRILVATDVAARGLDIPLIQHVINYDLPQVPEDYVHRIGRTARAGSEGSALTFLTPDDRSMWNLISKLIDPNFKAAPRDIRKNSRRNKRGKAPYNKKRKFRDKKRSSFGDKPSSFGRGRSDRSSRDGESKSFGFKGKKSFFKKNDSGKSSFGDKPSSFGRGRSDRSSRDGESKSFGFKGKKSFFKKNDSGKSSFGDKPSSFGRGRSDRSSRDGESKSFGFKGKKSFFKKNDSGKSSFGDKPSSFGRGRSDRSSRDGESKSFGFKGKKSFFKKNDSGKSSFGDKPSSFGRGRSDRSSRDGESKSFGFKGKKSFFKKNDSGKSSFGDKPSSFGRGRSDRSSRDGESKSFGFKGKKSFFKKNDSGKSSFGDKPSSFGRGRSDRSSRDGESKSFGFKGKKSFFKKGKSKPIGYTNNPKYFGKKPLEDSSKDSEKKSFGFKGRKKFKSRSNRPKSFTFKKHNRKRAKI